MASALAHLNALRSFEAAARHGSFTVAAQELCVTQAAVSHQIRQLEESLQTPLFERSHRRVVLTGAGQRLFATVSTALGGIERTLRDISEQGQTQPTLTILVTPSLGARWLARRLHRFWADNPEIDLHIYHALPHEQYAQRRVDLALRWGNHGCAPTQTSEVLFECTLVPVCAPTYIRPAHPISTASDLRHYTLLHEDSYEDWASWLLAAGVTEPMHMRGTIIDDSNTLIEAAINEQGIALGRTPLIQEELRNRVLIRPFDMSIHCNDSYYLVYEQEAEQRDAFQKFREFLLTEASETLSSS